MADIDKQKKELIASIEEFEHFEHKIKENKYIKKIFGSILALGNNLNRAEKTMNRADGFNITFL